MRKKQAEKGEKEEALSSEEEREMERPRSLIAEDSDEDDMECKVNKLGKGSFLY